MQRPIQLLKQVVDELQSLNEKLDGLKKEQDDLTYQAWFLSCCSRLVRESSFLRHSSLL